MNNGAAKCYSPKNKDNHRERMNPGERDAFVRGFSLAVRVMMEAI